VRSIEFTVSGHRFKLESDGNARRVIDRNNVEWSDKELVDLAGETEATTALAYAIRDLEKYTAYPLPHER
jgi:hypothetical protein